MILKICLKYLYIKHLVLYNHLYNHLHNLLEVINRIEIDDWTSFFFPDEDLATLGPQELVVLFELDPSCLKQNVFFLPS